ncbi:MAG TPA: hypothetical protein VG223_13800 [Solirubrobacteraceae bacterium]|nr:hypothetical protein [Solirubrobacteraceae bacterium]
MGTGAVCVLVAFGAAFLVARSVTHQSSARAATLTHLGTTPSMRIPARSDPQLADLYAPQLATLRLQIVHHVRKHKAPAKHASTGVTNASPPATSSTPAPTYVPSSTSAPSQSSNAGSGSGTTSIGGSGSHKSGGSGKTTIG